MKLNQDGREEYTFTKIFTEEETLQLCREFADANLEINKIKDEIKVLNEKMKPITETAKTQLSEIRYGSRKVSGVFEYMDTDNTREYFDDNGEIVATRPLMPSERQTSVFKIAMEG